MALTNNNGLPVIIGSPLLLSNGAEVKNLLLWETIRLEIDVFMARPLPPQ